MGVRVGVGVGVRVGWWWPLGTLRWSVVLGTERRRVKREKITRHLTTSTRTAHEPCTGNGLGSIDK